MKKDSYRLIDKEDLYFAGRMWRLRFEAPDIEAEPGQFVNIAVEGSYLRRPISVSEYEDGVLSLIVQPVGEGTRRLIETPVGASLDMLTGLGNKFTLPEADSGVVVIVGGGVGYAPLVGLMKKIVRETDLYPMTVFGFNREVDVPFHHISDLMDEFPGIGLNYSTMTGEMGDRGNAIEVAREYLDHYGIKPVYFYACGPMPMMEAACREFDCDGQLSLEARMGCGFGACMGCSIKTKQDIRRICKDGPVFRKSELY